MCYTADMNVSPLPPQDLNDAEAWWVWAASNPLQATAHPLYDLLTLESPERWLRLCEGNVDEWIRGALIHLPAPYRHLFAADAAARSLHWFEDSHPGDPRPYLAIYARRQYVAGLVSLPVLEEACNHAWAAAGAAPEGSAAALAARATAWRTAHAAADDGSLDASSAHARGVCGTLEGRAHDIARAKARRVERLWQWGALQRYLVAP